MMLVLFGCAAIVYSPAVPNIPLIHLWQAPPLLVVCAGAPGGLDRWEKAAARVEAHGGQWAGVVPSACNGLPEHGEVWVVPMSHAVIGYDAAGVTIIPSNGGIADRGITGVVDEVVDSWAPEHELLHVQGLDHHTMTRHILSVSLDTGGRSWDGVRAALRLAWAR